MRAPVLALLIGLFACTSDPQGPEPLPDYNFTRFDLYACPLFFQEIEECMEPLDIEAVDINRLVLNQLEWEATGAVIIRASLSWSTGVCRLPGVRAKDGRCVLLAFFGPLLQRDLKILLGFVDAHRFEYRVLLQDLDGNTVDERLLFLNVVGEGPFPRASTIIEHEN